jgi:hypothetical protein
MAGGLTCALADLAGLREESGRTLRQVVGQEVAVRTLRGRRPSPTDHAARGRTHQWHIALAAIKASWRTDPAGAAINALRQ